jgi:ankyrin repeat protein
VRLLIARGADLEAEAWGKARDRLGGWRPLHLAVAEGLDEIARILLDAGADPDAGNSAAGPPLLRALYFPGKEAAARLLIERGADLRATDRDGDTALHVAAESDLPGIARVLLEKGADPAARNRWGYTAIDVALSEGHQDAVEVLLSGGTRSKLCVAAGLQDLGRVTELLDGGESVKSRGNLGETALHWAVRRESIELTKLLIERGAEIDAVDDRGETPLWWACDDISEDMAALLVAWGADPNAKDKEGRAPLHSLLERGGRELVRILVESGADLNLKDAKGLTPLQQVLLEDGTKTYYGEEGYYGKIADLMRRHGGEE